MGQVSWQSPGCSPDLWSLQVQPPTARGGLPQGPGAPCPDHLRERHRQVWEGQLGSRSGGRPRPGVCQPSQDLGPVCTPGRGRQLTLSHARRQTPGAIHKDPATPSGTTTAGFPTAAAHCYPDRALRGPAPAPTPTLAGKAGSPPARPRRPAGGGLAPRGSPATACPLWGPACPLWGPLCGRAGGRAVAASGQRLCAPPPLTAERPPGVGLRAAHPGPPDTKRPPFRRKGVPGGLRTLGPRGCGLAATPHQGLRLCPPPRGGVFTGGI